MRLPQSMQWLIGGVAAGLLAYGASRGYFSIAKRSLHETLPAQKAELRRQWQEKLQVEQEEIRNQVEAKKLEAERKWQAALGDVTERPSKDPSLSISEMIEATAAACAPAGSKAALVIERFTEFTLTLEVPTEAQRSDLNQISACLLRHCGHYLQRVRFVRKGEVLAELAPEVLAQVADWKKINPRMVESLLEAPRADFRLTSAAEAGDSSSKLSPQEQKLQEAEEAFQEVFAAHFSICREMSRRQDAAVNFATIHSASDFENRTTALEQAEPRLKQAQGFFEHPEKEFAAILEKSGFDALVIQVTTRGYLNSARMQNAHLLFIFDKLTERQAATKKLLRTMSQHFGQWTISGEDGKLSFANPQAEAAYRAALEEFRITTGVLDQALKSMPAKKG